jgi:hypothetical protein
MGGADMMDELLSFLKENLVITHDDDDKLLRSYICAAIDYAENYQKLKYDDAVLPPATVQAILMLATHFYESRDGGTGGFFTEYVGAVNNVWTAVNRLLAMNKAWEV